MGSGRMWRARSKWREGLAGGGREGGGKLHRNGYNSRSCGCRRDGGENDAMRSDRLSARDELEIVRRAAGRQPVRVQKMVVATAGWWQPHGDPPRPPSFSQLPRRTVTCSPPCPPHPSPFAPHLSHNAITLGSIRIRSICARFAEQKTLMRHVSASIASVQS